MSQHFFSHNYGEAREKFQAACDLRGFRNMRFRIPAEESADLFIDFGLLKRDPKRCLIHISGVHGTEGYAGSAIQNAILADEFSPEGPSILFIHAVNPYGMAFYRRANAQNVDLNRNCLKNRDPKQNSDYIFFDTYLNPANAWQFYSGYLQGYLSLLRLGRARSAQAIASGQTIQPGGLFYAGAKIQREISLVQEFLFSHFKEAELAVALDVHTGLGTFGQEILFVHSEATQKSPAFFEAAFKRNIDEPDPKKGFYEPRGEFSQGLQAALPKTKLYYCLQEFGARSERRTFSALRRENYEWKKRILNNYPKNSVAKMMLDVFCPQEKNWRDNIINLGKTRFNQALAALEQT